MAKTSKNEAASALGKLSAKKRKDKPDFSAMGKKAWATKKPDAEEMRRRAYLSHKKRRENNLLRLQK